MNVLYILGNGFDKAQGLATTYREFYNDWLKKRPQSELEQKVLASICGDLDTWADLEKHLGEYSTEWTNEKDFIDVLKLFNVRLKEYLEEQNNRLNDLNLSRPRLFKHLSQPGLFLEPSGRSVYERFVRDFKGDVKIDVVTLNYTSTLETSLHDYNLREPFFRVEEKYCYLKGILHLHGKLDDMILVGVNDESQIANESFRASEYLRRSFIKPEINEGCMNTRNADFSQEINSADIIIFFGVSLGSTDNLWWHQVGLRMIERTPPLLLYFPYDPSKDTITNPNFKRIWCDEYISFLRERMQIKLSVESLRNLIRIGINKDFLRLSNLPEV